MKILLIIFFFIYSNLIFRQDIIVLKEVINNTKKEIIEQTDITKYDTIRLELSSASEIIIPTEEGVKTKVILVKEKFKMDYLKYIFPIFTLFLGIWIKRFFDKASDTKRIKKIGKRWIAEIRSLEEPMKKQIKSLKNFKTENLNEDFNIPRLTLFSYLDGEVFKSLDKNDLTEYIELNNKKIEFKDVIKISNNIHGFTSVLTHLHETLKEKFGKYLSGTSKHTTSLTKSLQTYMRAFRNYGVELEKELQTDPYQDDRYKSIADLYLKYITPNLDNGNFNPYILEKDFFLPLVEILRHLRLDNRTEQLSLSVTSSLNAIKGIKMEQNYMTENVETMIKHYQEQLAELKEVIRGLE
jgi:hypothetical protein